MVFSKCSNFTGLNKDIVKMVDSFIDAINCLTDDCDLKLLNDANYIRNNYPKVLMIAAKNDTKWFKVKDMSNEEHEFMIALNCAVPFGYRKLSNEVINKYYETYGPNLAFTSFILSNTEICGETRTLLALLALHYNSKQFAKNPELMVNWIGLPVAAQVYELLELMTFGYDRDTVSRIKKAIDTKQKQCLYLI